MTQSTSRREYEFHACWLGGFDWSLLVRIDDYVREQLGEPIRSYHGFLSLEDGTVYADSLAVMSTSDGVPRFADITVYGANGRVRFALDDEMTNRAVFYSENEAWARGVAAAVQDRIDKGLFKKPPTADATGEDGSEPSPAPAAERTLFAKAMNNAWVVGTFIGLGIAILVAIVVLITAAQ